MRATAKSMQAAKLQRRAMSPPEVRMWALLRRSPQGLRFRRQHPVGPYVADFYCPTAELVIEIDGGFHDFAAASAHDARRNRHMEGLGLRIVRIPAAEILNDVIAVCDGVIAICFDLVGPSTTQQS